MSRDSFCVFIVLLLTSVASIHSSREQTSDAKINGIEAVGRCVLSLFSSSIHCSLLTITRSITTAQRDKKAGTARPTRQQAEKECVIM